MMKKKLLVSLSVLCCLQLTAQTHVSWPEKVAQTLQESRVMEELNSGKTNVRPDVFTDLSCTGLKPGVNAKIVKKIRNPFYRVLAEGLLADSVADRFRVQYYEAYPPVQETARKLKTSGYNPYENPTGIYFTAGERIVVLAEDPKGEEISLRVHCFEKGEDHTYPLTGGLNLLTMKGNGLGYVVYYTSRWAKASPLKIQIIGGKVNGYFDKSCDKNEQWKQLLAHAACDYMDIKGDYVNLAYRVSSLRQWCPEKGTELIDFYDRVVDIEQEMMGLKKYNLRPKNHMFAREVEKGLFADGTGAGFQSGSMKELANPDKIIKGLWAIAHEFGHVNQIRPGLKWLCTTEVTNNMYSAWVRYLLDGDNLHLEHSRCNDGDGNRVLGGRFNSYLNYGVVKGELWLCQRGQDKMKDYENGGDHFVKLCPLWQLQLYYAVAGKGNYWSNPGWYGDVAQIVRNTDEKGLDNGQLQLNFMRNVADIAREDLSDFFIRAGMLKPIDKEMNDYGKGHLTITQQQCNELVKYMSRYPKPASPVIYYLSGNSTRAFQKRLPVTGVYGRGVEMRQESCVIAHRVWQNAVVFETYAGEELTHVAMVGTDSPDRSTTLVRYPENSTRIEAVAWDGTRILVWGKR